MPFISTEPQNGEIGDADFIRDQFNSLKDLIDAQALTLASQATDITSLTGSVASQAADLATLTARVTALEPLTGRVALLESLNASRGYPATLTVTGFGRADVNGTYTRIADYNGAPAWQILGSPGNVRIIWN